MKKEKILLGRIKKDSKSIGAGELISIEKHSWDCGWYWGFGYVGNAGLHFHFDSFLKSNDLFSEIFEGNSFSDNEWWIIRDLFTQAYALQKCAEVYKHGGHQTTKEGTTDIIVDQEMVKRLNKDLETVLNKVWDVLSKKTPVE